MDFRLQQEQNQHEDEMEMIQDDVRALREQLQSETSRHEHEVELAEQRISQLEGSVKEAKSSLNQ